MKKYPHEVQQNASLIDAGYRMNSCFLRLAGCASA
jgi:hypothetical protein